MRDLLEQIKQSLDANLYYLALFSSLSLPDICGAIGSEDGMANGRKYIEWFDKYVGPKYQKNVGPNGELVTFLSGEDCYYFRCSLLHQGRTQQPRSTYSRIIFVEPSTTMHVLHCNITNDALNIDVRIFCMDIIQGVESWLDEYEGTELYERNYNKFMRRYPDGIDPYIVGVSVIS